MQNSFTDDNFSELLYAVQLVESEGKGARPEYMDVVSSYFSQLTNKVENEEQFTFTSEVYIYFRNKVYLSTVFIIVA